MPHGADDPVTAAAGAPAPLAGARRHRGLLSALLVELRPHQWIKNSVIFAALIFSHSLDNPDHIWRSLMAFGLFCAVTSAVYVLNDIFDLESDRIHPIKSRRPIAAGEIPLPLAAVVGTALAAGGLLLSWRLSPPFAVLALVYLASNLLYSVWLKRIVIVDVMVISSGFVIRAVSGGLVIGVEVSVWLILCAICLSLFLGFTKRRQELAQLEARAAQHREILQEYSLAFLDQMISIVTAATVVVYFLYTLSPETEAKLGTPYLPFTIPFVLYGIFRYLYLVHKRDMGESPTTAFYADPPLFVNVILWAVTAIIILYLA